MQKLPDIAQQYVFFKGGWAILETALIVVMWIGIYRLWKWLLKKYAPIDVFDSPLGVILGMCCVFLLVASVVGVFGNARTALMAFTAPKILLIEWAATLAK